MKIISLGCSQVPNGFCIPGGRFRELYYWDTYWIVNGLLLCDMKQTARGVIENIMSMVNRFGFMPNGNRVYYLNRSQPPLLILMVFNYFQMTKDFSFIMNNIEVSSNLCLSHPRPYTKCTNKLHVK